MKSTRKSRERENPGLSHDNLCGVNEGELGKGCEECGEMMVEQEQVCLVIRIQAGGMS